MRNTLWRGMPFMMAVALLLFVAVPVSVAHASGNEAALKEIDSFLQQSIVEGYRTENIETFLSAYDEDAIVIDYIIGKLDKNGLRKATLHDFDILSNQQVSLALLEGDLDGAAATVLVNLSVKGDIQGGRKANRHDRYYMYLEKTERGWRIHKQGYKKDFSEGGFTHGKKRRQ